MSKYAVLQQPAPTWSIFDFAAAALVAPVFQAAEIAGDLLSTRRAPRHPMAAIRSQALLQPARPQPRFGWRRQLQHNLA